MKMRSALALAVLAGVAPLAIGQVARPKVYIWNDGGHAYTGTLANPTYLNTPDFKAIVSDYNHFSSPGQSASRTAARVYAQWKSTGPDHVAKGDTVFSLGRFGHFGNDTDSSVTRTWAAGGTSTLPDGVAFGSPLNFFTENGRVKFSQFDNGTDESFEFPDWAYKFAGRRYVNPVLLENANTDPNSPPPLKNWMIEFCKAYRNIQTDSQSSFWHDTAHPERVWDGDDPLPSPVRFHLDNETHDQIAWVMDDNHLWMLYRLALSDSPDQNSPYNYWSNPAYPVPGNDGMTLGQLYTAAVNANRLPANIFDSEVGLDLTFSNGQLAADNDQNRKFMLWYAEICRKARKAVMKNCYYDVVHSYWPDCKVTNYDDGHTDGQMGTTGWFLKPNDPNGINTAVDTDFPPLDPSNQLMRGWTHPRAALAGTFWTESSGMWNVYPTSTDADMSTVACYKLNYQDQFLDWWLNEFGSGNDLNGFPVRCAQQPNLYLRTSDRQQVLETRDETSIRRFRHIIESYQGSDGNYKDKIVPWWGLLHEGFSNPKYTRDLLAMFRSHKITETVGFSGDGRGVTINGASNPIAVKQWLESQEIFNQVYSPYVWDYTREIGTRPTTETTNEEAVTLEHVDVDTPSPSHTVNIESEESSGDQATMLDIEIRGLFDSTTGKGYFSTFNNENVDPEIAYGYTLYLECSLTPSGAPDGTFYGQVEVWDWDARQWITVRVIDSAQDDLARDERPRLRNSNGFFYEFLPTNPDGSRPTRIAIDIRPDVNSTGAPSRNLVSTATIYSNGQGSFHVAKGAMRLRLAHYATSSSDEFVSKYDLVQVVPFPMRQAMTNGGGVAGGIITTGTQGSIIPSANGNVPDMDNFAINFEFDELDLEQFPHAPEYYSNPLLEKMDPEALWEPSMLDDPTCTPKHDWLWHYENEGPISLGHSGNWPAGYAADAELIPSTRILNSRFNLDSSDPLQQKVVARFTLPIWTDAPAETSSNLNIQPYSVWYWITTQNRWADVTAGMQIQISRDPSDLNREVVISNRDENQFQAGYYALTLNVTPPAEIPNPYVDKRYAVYCSGTLNEPGVPVAYNTSEHFYTHGGYNVYAVQYNFRLYPDCDLDGDIDDTEAQCNLYNGTDCPADMDDGSGTGTPDDGVDINDLLYFLAKFELGALEADMDNGTGLGIPDYGVDISDLLFFLTRFEAGC